MRPFQRLSIVIPALLAIIPWGHHSRGNAAEELDAITENAWSLVFTVGTRPEGDVAVKNGGVTKIMTNYQFTATAEVRFNRDGTFSFDRCDTGYCLTDVAVIQNGAVQRTVTICEPVFRGSGKWETSADGKEGWLALKLEYQAGKGTGIQTLPGGKIQTGFRPRCPMAGS